MTNSYKTIINIINILLAFSVLCIISVSLYFVYIHTIGKSYVKKNWSSQKCNLFVFPMSHLYTSDPVKNIENCSKQHSNTILKLLKQPIIILVIIFKYVKNTVVNIYNYTMDSYVDNMGDMVTTKDKKQLKKKKNKLNNKNGLKPLNFKQK